MAKLLAIAILLSIIITGLGQVYLGYVKRGIVILITGIGMSVLLSVLLPFPFPLIPLGVFWLWQIIDTGMLYKKSTTEIIANNKIVSSKFQSENTIDNKEKNKAYNTSLVYFLIGGILFVFGLIFMLFIGSDIIKFSKLQDICDVSRLTGFGYNIIRENCEGVSNNLSIDYLFLVLFSLPLASGFLLIIAGILDYRKYQKLNRKLEELKEKEQEEHEKENNNQVDSLKEHEETKEGIIHTKEETKKPERDYFSKSAFVRKNYDK